MMRKVIDGKKRNSQIKKWRKIFFLENNKDL